MDDFTTKLLQVTFKIFDQMNQAAEVFGYTNSRELIAKLAKKDDDKPNPAKDKGKVASTSNAAVTPGKR